MNVDFDLLNQAFSQWALGYVTIEKDDWLSIDGKSIKSTFENYSSSYQNFVSMVSVFSQKRGQVIRPSPLKIRKSVRLVLSKSYLKF